MKGVSKKKIARVGGQASQNARLREGRQRPTLPRARARSTIGAEGLNFRVRDGIGCFPLAMATGQVKKRVGETLVLTSVERRVTGVCVSVKRKERGIEPHGRLVRLG